MRKSILLSTLLVILCASNSFAAVRKAEVHVILNDESIIEGTFLRETKTTFTVKIKYQSKTIKKADIKAIYCTEESTIDRFKVKRQANDLMLLYARLGRRVSLKDCEKIVEKINLEKDPIKAAGDYIAEQKLLPENIDAVVEANRAEFKKENGSDVIEIITPRYYVLSTSSKKFTQKVAYRMMGIFKEFQKQLNFAERITCRFIIKVYGSRSEYIGAGAPPSSAAYFSPSKMELVGYYSQDENQILSNFYHEGMHQFLHFYVPDPPLWFDEGLAQYFETSKPRGSGYKTGIIHTNAARYLNVMAKRSKAYPSVKRLIKMEREEFYYSNASENYAAAWVLTHLMIKSRDSRIKQFYLDYFYLLRGGATRQEANDEIFGNFNMKMLQKAFEKHVKKM